ncbi:MAG: hypothetical protein P8020_20915 [Acidobacteriota bacterium]
MAIVAPGEQGFRAARAFKLIYRFPDAIFSVVRTVKDAFGWLGVEGERAEWGRWKGIRWDTLQSDPAGADNRGDVPCDRMMQ